MEQKTLDETRTTKEILPQAKNGVLYLVLSLVLFVGSVLLIIIFATFTWGIVRVSGVTVGILLSGIVCPILWMGIKIIKPNEALVLTLFGKYWGTLKTPGCYFVHPFVSSVSPFSSSTSSGVVSMEFSQNQGTKAKDPNINTQLNLRKKISLKSMTLNNDKQKINDLLGNPIIIGIVVIWKVVDTAKAMFDVDNYTEFLSIQCDSALRNIVRLYPYDSANSENEETLRGSSQELASKLKDEIQSKVEIAGLEISEARITNLAYAPEIAAAMLQRQQASAVIDARQMIVDGAVGMVEMALSKLSENNIVQLDEERKAAMVSNLLVVLCANKDAQPIVNSGSLY